MIKKLFLFFLLSFFFFSLLFPQQQYKGRLFSKTSPPKAIDFAWVKLLRADSLLISYTYSATDGSFSIENTEPKNSRFIAFSSMGYKALVLPLADFVQGTDVYLEEAALEIKEVMVSSKRIQQKSDTIVYNVSRFKMGQDRSIEDVLKKMPGIEVSEGGQIKFQDKPISHLYIEGMNLLEGRYALATKNLAAQKVKSVEVLQNHQAIAALRGRSFSEQAALNLVLTDDAKMSFQGTANLGVGIEPDKKKLLFDNRLLGMLFAPRMQNLSMYKNNNTGTNIASELRVLTRESLLSGMATMRESDILSSSELSVGGLEQSRRLFNNAHLLTVNHLYKPSKEIDWRVQLSGLRDKNEQDYFSSTAYLYPNQTIRVDELRSSLAEKRKMDGELMFQVNKSDLYIRNKLNFLFEQNEIQRNMIINEQKIAELVSPDRRELRNDFQFLKNKKGYSYSFRTMNAYFDLPQHLRVSPGLYASLLNENKPYDSFSQDVRLKSFHSHSYTSFQHKLFGFYLNYKAGVMLMQQNLNAALSLHEAGINKAPFEGGFENNLRFRETKTYLEPSFNYKNYRLEVRIKSPIYLYFADLQHTFIKTQEDKKLDLLLEPKFNFIWNMSALWSFKTNFSHSYSSNDIRELYSESLFKSYRSNTAHRSKLKLDDTQRAALTLDYKRVLSGFFMSVNGSFSRSNLQQMYVYKNEGILSFFEAVDRPHQSFTKTLSTRISKAYDWNRTQIGLSANYSENQNLRLLNNRETQLKSELLYLKFDCTLQPSSFLNFDVSSSLSLMNSSLAVQGARPKEISNFKHQINLNIIPLKSMSLRWNNSLSHGNDFQQTAAFFSDVFIAYKLRKFDFELIFQNVFNNNAFEQTMGGAITETFVSFQLRPRSVLFKCMFSF